MFPAPQADHGTCESISISVVVLSSIQYLKTLSTMAATQVAQALAGVGTPQEPMAWQAQVLSKVDALDSGTAVPLTRAGSMFDWRLVAAVRALCASEPQQLEGRDPLQLGDLNWQLADSVEVRVLLPGSLLLHGCICCAHVTGRCTPCTPRSAGCWKQVAPVRDLSEAEPLACCLHCSKRRFGHWLQCAPS